MTTVVKHAVIHSFTKKAHSNDLVDVTKKQKVLDIDKPAVVALINGVNGLLGKPGNILSYGQFGDNMRQGKFPTAFADFVSPEIKNSVFLNLSHLVVDELVEQALKELLATGGRILVTAYESDSRPFFLVAMIKERGGIVLDDDYVPIEIVEVDLSKVYQAARISITRYKEVIKLPDEVLGPDDVAEDRTYLAFLGQGTHNQASGYFVEALGCTKGIASSRATNNVLKAVTEFFSTPELKPYRSKAKFAVEAYLQRQLDTSSDAVLVDIAHGATSVLQDKQADHVESFKEYLNSDKVKIPAVFAVHAATLKKSTKIKAESKNGWTAQFDRRLLGNTQGADVYFDEGNKSLTFKGLDDNAIEEIQKELTSRNS